MLAPLPGNLAIINIISNVWKNEVKHNEFNFLQSFIPIDFSLYISTNAK